MVNFRAKTEETMFQDFQENEILIEKCLLYVYFTKYSYDLEIWINVHINVCGIKLGK